MWLILSKHALPTLFHAELVAVGQTAQAYLRSSAGKLGHRRLTFQCRNRHGLIAYLYDFLLGIHGNYGSIYGTVLEMNGDFGEIHNFPTPRVFNVNAEGFPWNLVTVVLLKIRRTYLPDAEKVR